MKILIVDDHQKKCKQVMNVIEDQTIEAMEIEVAHTAMDARHFLEKNRYDLLILDLMLPNRVGDDTKIETSLELLRDIAVSGEYLRPTHIVGLTAYDDAFLQADDDFKKFTWTILRYSEAVDAWKTSLSNCLKYVHQTLVEDVIPEFDVDLCIVTALSSPELKAVFDVKWDWAPDEPMDDVQFIRRGQFHSEGKAYSVIAASASRMGMVSASVLSARLIEKYRPRLLVMTGICAGMKGKVNLGDVILADPCWDWQSGKHTVEKTGRKRFLIGSHQIASQESIRTHVTQLGNNKHLLEDIKNGFPGAPDTSLRVHIGPMASGSSVLADGLTINEIKDQHRSLLAVEMEAYGVYLAASVSSRPRPAVFALKAVCDFADDEKDDNFQNYASYTSASVLRALVETYFPKLILA